MAEQCLETAMPYGGNITVVQNENGWVLRGSCDKFRIDQQLWSMLAEGKLPSDIAPAHVHFALLASHCRDEGHRLHTELGNDEIVIRI